MTKRTLKWRPAEENLVRMLLPTSTYREIAEQLARRFDKGIPGFPCARSEDSVRHKCVRENWTAESVVNWVDPVKTSFEELQRIQAEYDIPQDYIHRGIIEPAAIARKILSLSDIHFPMARLDLLEQVLDEHDDSDVLVLNGDILEGHVFSTFAKHRRIAAVHEYNAAFEFVTQASERFSDVVLVSGNHDCLSEDTLCLTNYGWKKYTELSESDWVYTLDTETGLGEWQQVQQVHVYNYEGTMFHVDEGGTNMCITPNHRVLHKRRNRSQPYAYEKASEFPSTRTSLYVPTAASTWTPECVEAPIQALKALGKMLKDPADLNIRDRDLLKEFFNTKDYDTVSPLAWLLSREQFDVVLRAAARSRTADAQGYVFSFSSRTARKNHAIGAAFHSLLAQNGYGTWMWDDNDYTSSDVYALTARPEAYVQLAGGFEANALETPGYQGKVWCVTVPNSNFFVRRGTRAFFTGNSRVSRALKQGGIDNEALDIIRPDLIARIANGEKLDESGMLIDRLPFENVHYDRREPWYARIGNAAFVHPHTKGSAQPGFTVKRTAKYLEGRYDDLDAIICGHTHQLYWGVTAGKLMIEQGHMSGLHMYAHEPRTLLPPNTYNGYAIVYQDGDGNTDFNLSRPVYLGEAVPPKKDVALKFK